MAWTPLSSTARLLDTLRGPFNSTKLGLLHALDLFRFLTAQRPPPQASLAMRISIGPDQVNADGKDPIVVAAEVAVAPDDFEKFRYQQVALPFDRVRLTLELSWYPDAHCAIRRFETGTSEDFTKGEWTNIPFAAFLCRRAVDTLLASARFLRSTVNLQPEDPPLSKREQGILDVVAEFQFAHAETRRRGRSR